LPESIEAPGMKIAGRAQTLIHTHFVADGSLKECLFRMSEITISSILVFKAPRIE
jgi:hypothetical protein